MVITPVEVKPGPGVANETDGPGRVPEATAVELRAGCVPGAPPAPEQADVAKPRTTATRIADLEGWMRAM
jgi:hypothetical protein